MRGGGGRRRGRASLGSRFIGGALQLRGVSEPARVMFGEDCPVRSNRASGEEKRVAMLIDGEPMKNDRRRKKGVAGILDRRFRVAA